MTEHVNIAETSAPKSDDLGVADILDGPITVTITRVTVASREGKRGLKVYIDGGHKPWWPPKTTQRMLAKRWGFDGADWVGHRVTLFADPGAEYAGIAVGGVRVSHMTGITEPFTEALNEKRKSNNGKPLVVTVHPLSAAACVVDPVQAAIDDVAVRAPARWDEAIGIANDNRLTLEERAKRIRVLA